MPLNIIPYYHHKAMFTIEYKKVCGIFLSWDLFFVPPQGMFNCVYTATAPTMKKMCIRSSIRCAHFFYVTFNNFNDFFHGNSLLIKMQTLKMKTHSFCVLGVSLHRLDSAPSICGDVIDVNFIIIVYSLALLCKQVFYGHTKVRVE